MLTTARLIIRPFEEQDAPDLFEALSDPSVYRFEPGAPISLAEARELARQRAGEGDFWAVVRKSDQKMVGHLYFKRIEPQIFETWELGYIFNPAYQNQGYATESARELIAFAFTELRAHRIIAHCAPENIASWKVLEKLGMRREGLFRQNIFFHTTADGSPIWMDSYAYAILRTEFAGSAPF